MLVAVCQSAKDCVRESGQEQGLDFVPGFFSVPILRFQPVLAGFGKKVFPSVPGPFTLGVCVQEWEAVVWMSSLLRDNWTAPGWPSVPSLLQCPSACTSPELGQEGLQTQASLGGLCFPPVL